MPRTIVTLFALATLSAAAPLVAQSAYSAVPATSTYSDPSYAGSPAGNGSYTQPAAPIERNYTNGTGANGYGYGQPTSSQGYPSQPANATSEPAHGVWLVSAPDASVQTVTATAGLTELRVERGRANVNVYHPADHSEIQVDLPGGAVSLVKDGLYTFNADTNTVRVLHGEAEITVNGSRLTKVKEDHEFTFTADAKAHEADPDELRADLLQGNYGRGDGYRHGDGYGYGAGFYGYGPYAYGWPYYGFYGPGWGYPGYAFGGPFGWGYPYGYGYGLGIGVGFGYYGGFGGFRGGYGGFRGGGFGGFRR